MVTAGARMVASVPDVVVFGFQVACPPRRNFNFPTMGRYYACQTGVFRFENMKTCVTSFCFRGSASVFFSLHPDGSLAFSRRSWPLWGLRWTLLDLTWSLLALSGSCRPLLGSSSTFQ